MVSALTVYCSSSHKEMTSAIRRFRIALEWGGRAHERRRGPPARKQVGRTLEGAAGQGRAMALGTDHWGTDAGLGHLACSRNGEPSHRGHRVILGPHPCPV